MAMNKSQSVAFTHKATDRTAELVVPAKAHLTKVTPLGLTRAPVARPLLGYRRRSLASPTVDLCIVGRWMWVVLVVVFVAVAASH